MLLTTPPGALATVDTRSATGTRGALPPAALAEVFTALADVPAPGAAALSAWASADTPEAVAAELLRNSQQMAAMEVIPVGALYNIVHFLQQLVAGGGSACARGCASGCTGRERSLGGTGPRGGPGYA